MAFSCKPMMRYKIKKFLTNRHRHSNQYLKLRNYETVQSFTRYQQPSAFSRGCGGKG